jgi:predicted RNase H-like nuclease (RuvC/YqgF family)
MSNTTEEHSAEITKLKNIISTNEVFVREHENDMFNYISDIKKLTNKIEDLAVRRELMKKSIEKLKTQLKQVSKA